MDQTLKIVSESLNPQHSAEVSQNAKGELTYCVKVYAADEHEAVRRAAAAFEELRNAVKPQPKAA